MAKIKSFADKMNKTGQDSSKHCSECGESKTMVKLITSEQSPETKAWRFRHRFVGICKCNENQITG